MSGQVRLDHRCQVGVDHGRLRSRQQLDQRREVRRARDVLEPGLPQHSGPGGARDPGCGRRGRAPPPPTRTPSPDARVAASRSAGPSCNAARSLSRRRRAARLTSMTDVRYSGAGPLDAQSEEVRPLLVADQQEVTETPSSRTALPGAPRRSSRALVPRVVASRISTCRAAASSGPVRVTILRRQDRGLHAATAVSKHCPPGQSGARILKLDHRCRRVVPGDRHRLVLQIEPLETQEATDEVIVSRPIFCSISSRRASIRPQQASPQGAAGEHLGPMKRAGRIERRGSP